MLFGGPVGDGVIHVSNDTDGDSIPDGVEYVFGGSASVVENTDDFYGFVPGSVVPTFWTRQTNLAQDVAVKFKVSDDLLSWYDALEVESTDLSQRWFTIDASNDLERLFFKVEVSEVLE